MIYNSMCTYRVSRLPLVICKSEKRIIFHVYMSLVDNHENVACFLLSDYSYTLQILTNTRGKKRGKNTFCVQAYIYYFWLRGKHGVSIDKYKTKIRFIKVGQTQGLKALLYVEVSSHPGRDGPSP